MISSHSLSHLFTVQFLVLAALAAAGPLGCNKTRHLQLRDTEGRRFDAVCEEGDCRVRAQVQAHPSATRPPDAEAKFVLHRGSRIYGICEVWKQKGGSMSIDPADCRPLTCSRDEDCPPIIGLLKGSCTNGLCIEPSGPINHEDAIMLCLAGTGAPAKTTRQVERYALGNSCGNPCRVPPVCRQP